VRHGPGGLQVFGFKIREVDQDLLAALTGGLDLKDVLDADPHAANAGPAAALLGVVGDATAHGGRLSAATEPHPLAGEPSSGLEASLGAVPFDLDRQYRFSAPELKAGSHRLDGVLWPLGSETGSEELPVVLLEVQMRADPGFHHRLAAQTFRFLQLHPRIEHWRVVVITPHQRLQLGPVLPLRGFLEQVHWVSLEELGRQQNLDAAVDLLTLPVRSEPELADRCRRILASRRDLEPVVFSMLFERFPQLSKEQILMIAGLPLQQLRHSRAVQEILEEGMQEGRQEGREEGLEAGRQQEAAALAIRLLIRRLGSLDVGSRDRLSTLPLQQLEQLAEDLLDFTEPGDLQAWFDNHPAG
jgi:predicted transposase YdaD